MGKSTKEPKCPKCGNRLWLSNDYYNTLDCNHCETFYRTVTTYRVMEETKEKYRKFGEQQREIGNE